jgi:hypothetical protein
MESGAIDNQIETDKTLNLPARRGRVVVAFCLGLLISLAAMVFGYHKLKVRLLIDHNALSNAQVRLKKVERQRAEITAKLQTLNNQQKQQHLIRLQEGQLVWFLNVLKSLVAAAGSGAWLSELSWHDNQLVVEGKAVNLVALKSWLADVRRKQVVGLKVLGIQREQDTVINFKVALDKP